MNLVNFFVQLKRDDPIPRGKLWLVNEARKGKSGGKSKGAVTKSDGVSKV